MKKDYGTIPANKIVKNETENTIKFDLRDICFQVPVVIEPGNSISVTLKSSEGLAILYRKAEELGLTIENGSVEPEPEEPVEVADEESLRDAITSGAESVKLTSNITVPSGKLDITGVKEFNGNGKTITFNTTGQNLVSTTDGTVIENVVVDNTVATEDWSSTYCMQVYNGTYTIRNCTLKGGNAGLLVNGANATLEGTIDISGNKFGGIEVSKGSASGLENSTLNVNGATLVNTTEAYGKPTIWTDGEGQTVTGVEAMFTNSEVKPNQVQYYLVEANSKAPISEDEDLEETEPTL